MHCREQAKKYLEAIYTSHKTDDIEAWNRLIDCLFDYIDLKVEKYHGDDDLPIE